MKNLIYSMIVLLSGLQSLQAFPPAPHHTIQGMVRDEMGNPLTQDGTIIRFTTATGAVLETNSTLGIGGETNYRILIPMDSGANDTPYSIYAQTMNVPYQIEVISNGRSFLPIELRGVSLNLGKPGGITRLDLTLGEDIDGDGLPDAWEKALMQLAGSLENINGSDDSDGDGLTNLEEYRAGTYAFDENDGLRLVFREINNEKMVFEFLGITGRSYRLMESVDLTEWNEVPFEVEGQEEEFSGVHVPSTQMVRVIIPREDHNHKNFKLIVE